MLYTTPTWELGGQAYSPKSTAEHWGVACGLPTTPVGRWVVMFSGSWQKQFVGKFWMSRFSKVKSVSIFGCPPACVFDGVIEKEVIGTFALSGDGKEA